MLRVHHVGYAVKRLNRAIKQMKDMGYEVGNIVEDTDRNICIVFGNKDGYRIELVSPLSKGSPVDRILTEIGPTPYHICYESDDFEKDLEIMFRGG